MRCRGDGVSCVSYGTQGISYANTFPHADELAVQMGIIKGEYFKKKFKFENVKSLTILTIQVSDAAGNTQYISTL